MTADNLKFIVKKTVFIITLVIWSVTKNKIKPIRCKGLIRLSVTQRTIKGLPTRS